jgi:hypothetical protein
VTESVSSYLVFQLYCTPAQANATRSTMANLIGEFPEFAGARIVFTQTAESDYEMHRDWAVEHQGQDPADRAYFLLRVESPTTLPESVLREAECAIEDWIELTYNQASDEIDEVPWGSYAGSTLLSEPERPR